MGFSSLVNVCDVDEGENKRLFSRGHFGLRVRIGSSSSSSCLDCRRPCTHMVQHLLLPVWCVALVWALYLRLHLAVLIHSYLQSLSQMQMWRPFDMHWNQNSSRFDQVTPRLKTVRRAEEEDPDADEWGQVTGLTSMAQWTRLQSFPFVVHGSVRGADSR